MAIESNTLEILDSQSQVGNRKQIQSFRYSFAGMRLGVTLITPTVEVRTILLMEELLRFLPCKYHMDIEEIFIYLNWYQDFFHPRNLFSQSILVDALGSKPPG